MSVVLTRASTAARELYHNVWQDVGKTFYDVERLRHWASWEHRFDDEIEDFPSARRCIDLLLDTLEDSYTRRLSDAEVVEKQEQREAEEGAVFSRRFHGCIGYLRILGFDSATVVHQVQTELRKISDCDGFIIDLSDNGGGLIDDTVNCCELVLKEGPVGTIKFRSGDGVTRNEVGFGEDVFVRISTKPNGEEVVDGFRRRDCLIAGKPVVLIIDGGTASSAEIFASALLVNGHDGGMVYSVGKQTFGKGIGQRTITYEDGTRVKVTFSRFYGADDRWFGDAQQTVANGIVPDEEVDGWNEQMTAAMNWLRRRLGIS